MKITYILSILLTVICILMSSCFIRLPAYSRDQSEKYVGKIYVLQRDIIIVICSACPNFI